MYKDCTTLKICCRLLCNWMEPASPVPLKNDAPWSETNLNWEENDFELGGKRFWIGSETILNWERNDFELGAKRLWVGSETILNWERKDFELGGETTLNWERNDVKLGGKRLWIWGETILNWERKDLELGGRNDSELGAKRFWVCAVWNKSWGETTAIWVIYLRKKISFNFLVSILSPIHIRIVQAYQSLSETKILTTGKPP